MNYVRVGVWTGFLVVLFSFPSLGKGLEESVSQQVQQSVDNAQFAEIEAEWEVAVVEQEHFRIKTVRYSCPAVLTPTAALVPSTCVLPRSPQGILLPKGNVLLQRVSVNSVRHHNKQLFPLFKQLPAWYTAVGSQEPDAREGRVYTTWLKDNRHEISMYDGAMEEDGQVFVYGGQFSLAQRDPGLSLKSAYFQSRTGERIPLALPYAHQNGWTVLSPAGR